jgi:hypothetical protein
VIDRGVANKAFFIALRHVRLLNKVQLPAFDEEDGDDVEKTQGCRNGMVIFRAPRVPASVLEGGS